MTELLALPGWTTAKTPLSAWVGQLESQGLTVVTTRESTGVSWVEVAALRLRGYAVTSGQEVEAINFELTAPDPEPARRVVLQAAEALAWEVHEGDDDEPEGDE